MFISKKFVREFQRVYEEKLGQSITPEEAEQMLSDFVELIKLMEAGRISSYENQSKEK